MGATTPEGRIKKGLTTVLKALGVWYFFPAANGMGRGGIPDLICIVSGKFVGIECKADKSKKPTTLQLQCAEQICNAGGEWFLVYDTHSILQVAEWIKKQREGDTNVSSGESQGSRT